MNNKQKLSIDTMDLNSLLAVITSSPIAQNKIKFIFMVSFVLFSLYLLTYVQDFNIASYVNATTNSPGSNPSLGESIQKSQQDLQRSIENQVQQTFTDTINSMHKGQANTTIDSQNIQSNILITKILAKSLENYIQNAGAVLNVTSQLPQVREVPLGHILNQTLT